MYFRFCYQTGKMYVQSGERFCKFSRGYTLKHMEVCDEVSVVPVVEGEDSVMESGITDSENTETNSDINSDRRSMMMESRIYSQIIKKKRLNQIKEKFQRLHIRKELVLSYE